PPGGTLGDGFDTTTTGKRVKAWVDGIAVVVGGLLMLVPEPTGLTKAIGIVLLAATAGRACGQVAGHLRLGMGPPDSRHIFYGLSIVPSVLGRGGTELRGPGIRAARPLPFSAGNSLALGPLGTDGGTLAYETERALAALRVAAADPTLDDGQKAQAIFSTIA